MRHLTQAVLGEVVARSPIFTTAEAASAANTSIVSAARALRSLEEAELIMRLTRGIWAAVGHPDFSPYAVVPFLLRPRFGEAARPGDNPAEAGWDIPLDLDGTDAPVAYTGYVSFVSALHLHGMLSQIPRVIHVAVRTQRGAVRTPVATYQFHQLGADLFGGAEAGDQWGRFALATPAKALVDTLYLSTKRGRQFKHLPEIELPYRTATHLSIDAPPYATDMRMRELSMEVEAIIAQVSSPAVRNALLVRWRHLRSTMEREMLEQTS